MIYLKVQAAQENIRMTVQIIPRFIRARDAADYLGMSREGHTGRTWPLMPIAWAGVSGGVLA